MRFWIVIKLTLLISKLTLFYLQDMNEPSDLIDNHGNQKKAYYSCPDNKYDYPLVKMSKYKYYH